MSFEITNVSLPRCTWKIFRGIIQRSFELLKHHAYHSRGYSWYWQDHKSIYELPLHQTLQRPMHLPKDTNDFYKVCCKCENGLLPTCPCDTRDSISTWRQEAPAKVWGAVDTFRSTCTFSTFSGLRALHGGNQAKNWEGEGVCVCERLIWQPMLELITLDSNSETNCLNQFWLQQWWQLHILYIYTVSTILVQYNSLKLSITGDPKSKRRLLFTSQRCPQPESRQQALFGASWLDMIWFETVFPSNFNQSTKSIKTLAEVTNCTTNIKYEKLTVWQKQLGKHGRLPYHKAGKCFTSQIFIAWALGRWCSHLPGKWQVKTSWKCKVIHILSISLISLCITFGNRYTFSMV